MSFLYFLSSIEFNRISVTNEQQGGRTAVRLSNQIISFFFLSIDQVHKWIVSLDYFSVCVCYMMQKRIQHMVLT